MKKEIKSDPESWLRILNEMIESGEFIWAEDFLVSVRDQVEEKGEITKKQTAGILNIRRSGQ